MKIGKCARAAVGYIYQCFQDNHQRVIGQGAAQVRKHESVKAFPFK